MIQGYGVNLFVVEQVERMLIRGDVTADRKFFQEGMAEWTPLSELATILGRPITSPRPKFAASQIARVPLENLQVNGGVPPLPLEDLTGNAAHAADPSASSFRRVSSIKLAKGTLRFRTDLNKLE